jgi:hypothetical protein
LDALAEATRLFLGVAAMADVIHCLYEREGCPDGLRLNRDRLPFSSRVPIHSVEDARMVIAEFIAPALTDFFIPWMESARSEDGALAASQQDFGEMIAYPVVLALAFNRYDTYLHMLPTENVRILREDVPKLFDYLRARGEIELPPGIV